MDTLKSITGWQKVFLDTSVILRLLHSMRSDCTDSACLFVKRLVKQLVDSDALFFISSISESEIIQRYELKEDKKFKVLNAIGSNDTTFVSFDSEIAYHLTQEYYQLLNKQSVLNIANDAGLDNTHYDIVREHVTRDLMIIATSDFYDCDVILTCDKKTMYRQANDLNLPCAVVFPEYFEHTNAGIFQYLQSDLDKELGLI